MSNITFAMIKPDATKIPRAVPSILGDIVAAGFRILGMKMDRMNKPGAASFYSEHKDKPYYGALVGFMSSGPVIALVLENPYVSDPVQAMRNLIGPTDPRKCAPPQIRGIWGNQDGKIHENAIHASDSPEAVIREAQFFFDLEALKPAGDPQYKFVARRNCEYSKVFVAKDLQEAYAKAHDSDAREWEQSWSDVEVEPE